LIQRKLLNVRLIVTPGSHEQNAVLWFFNSISTTLSDLAIKFVRHKFLGTGLLDLFFAPVPVFRGCNVLITNAHPGDPYHLIEDPVLFFF